MIKRCYVHNFRCLENFELPIAPLTSALLLGRNGSGKSTVSRAIEVLQRVGRGTNRVGTLVQLKDFSRGRADSPMRFELEVELGGHAYGYVLAFEFPAGFKEPRVMEEQLRCDGVPQYSRDRSQVTLGPDKGQARFLLDWHQVALPIVQERDDTDPIAVFKRWLSRMLILAPEPGRMTGESTGASMEPDRSLTTFGEWFTGLVAHSPEAYSSIVEHLRGPMPDLKSITNPSTGKDSRSLSVLFESEGASLPLAFTDLSDGEKCLFAGALVLASTRALGPLFCFWDEPESHLSIPEVRQFVMALRRGFGATGQFVMTSHHPEAIRAFSPENTFLLSRRTHLEPTQIRRVEDIPRDSDDLIDALLLGELE